nr:UvrD-helicase domain-containing protein [Candidatus Omnitrophota bacterium]
MKLNRAQEMAVTKSGKNILVSAGAGTGKTRVLVERFLHFVLTGEALVTEILALTFTEKAAAEMKGRIYERFKERGLFQERRQLESAAISTLHSFAARILREHPLEAAVAPDFRVIEAEEADFMCEQAMESVFEEHCRKGTGIFDLIRVYGENAVRAGVSTIYREARHEGSTVAEFLAKAKKQDAPLSPVSLLLEAGESALAEEWQRFEVLENWDWPAVEDYKLWIKGLTKRKSPWPEIKIRVKQFLAWKLDQMMPRWMDGMAALSTAFEASYERAKQEKSVLDFDDLEIKAALLFRQKTEVSERIREVYQTQYRHILVDEFQDTSPLQLELIEALSKGDNLFLVGDYKQSIYAFRGAEPELFHTKEKAYAEFEGGVKISLLENYRTVPDVLDWINRFFENLWAEDGYAFEGLLPGVDAAAKPGEISILAVEAAKGEEKSHARLREAEMIAARICELNASGCPYGEMAVLFEAMTDAPLYEYALKKAGIPYFSVSSRGFYQQAEVRDMMSLLSF